MSFRQLGFRHIIIMKRDKILTSRYLGKRVHRTEDARFLTGNGRYVADIKLSGMLHAAFLRSPYAHAIIKQVNIQQAKALPGVFAVYTGEALQADPERLGMTLLAKRMCMPGHLPHSEMLYVPPLAVGKVRFMGDPVAVVVAKDRYVAEDALDLIEVTYEPLTPVMDAEEASRPDVSLIDEEMSSPRGGPKSNIVAHYSYHSGNVEGAFAQADKVINVLYRQHRQTHAPMETRGCIANWNRREQTLELHTSTQRAHILRDALAPLLGLARHKVRVITPDVGGGFGQKGTLHREEVVISLLARLLRRPVKWIEDRRENLMASTHAREETCYLDVAVKEDGTILAIKAKLFSDMGAYPTMIAPPQVFSLLTASGIAGPWKFDSFAYDAIAVLTNKCPIAAYRAPMLASNVIHQHLMQLIAQELGLDPIDLYRKHIIREADQPYQSPNGDRISGVTIDQTLEKALELIDYRTFRAQQAQERTQGRYLGLGLGTFIELGAITTEEYQRSGTHPHGYGEIGWNSSTVRVEASGEVTLMVGTSSYGQGHETTLAQVVAHELGVSLSDVVVKYGDTARDPYGAGTIASQSMVIGGGATQRASQQVRDKIFRIAAHLLEVSPADLEQRGEGRIGVKGVPNAETTLADVGHVAYFEITNLPEGEPPGLEATSTYEPPHSAYYNGTHACIVEVDIQTGQVTIKRYVAVSDCGTVINPMIVEGQILGGIAQGLGGVLYEHAAYTEDGTFLADTLMDYMLPMAADMPQIEIEHIEIPAPDLPYGAKPVAEGGVVGAAPAIINAIADALSPFGIKTTHQPFTPSRIRDLLRATVPP